MSERFWIFPRFWLWLAWRLPRRLVYWATIRLATWNYNGNPADRPVVDALKAWHG